MSLDAFRARVQEYRRALGLSQKQIARELGLNPTVLSHKLHETDGMRLTQIEVKAIINVLANWKAISRRSEAVELLDLMNLLPSAFSEAEWAKPPLSTLQADMPVDNSAPVQPAPAAQTTVREVLISPVTPLIGREALVASICERLADPLVRLVTLTGAGGIGKTRLALEVARQMEAAFADGVIYVPLASISSPELVADEIAHHLRIKVMQSGAPLIETLKDNLANRHTLLVLDNFEHVLSAASLVAELIGATTRLTVLVTSRAVLNLYGEYQVRVPPLMLPDMQHLGAADQLAHLPSVELFVARTQAVRHDFALTETNARAVAEICVRLDGMPLAMELAAARCRLFSPEALLQRLDQPLTLLSGGLKNVPLRQRTLRDTIAWSYALLTEPEQELFRIISAFPGGCTLEALKTMRISPVGDMGELLDDLSSLFDKSLLERHEMVDGEPRFTMLETLREYGIDLLHESGEWDRVREQQALFFVRWLEVFAPGLSEENQGQVAERIEAELDNLRAALVWTLVNAPMECVRLCGHLAYFWNIRGYIGEGERWLAQALQYVLPEAAHENDAVDYARALHGDGMLAMLVGDMARAQTSLEVALSLSERIGDLGGQARALVSLGDWAWEQSEMSLAQARYEAAVDIARRLGNPRMEASALNNLGALLWVLDNLTGATAYLSAALELWRKLKHKRGIAQTLSNLGIVAVKQELFDRASVYYAESLTLDRELRDERSIAITLNNMGELALHKADYVGAQALYEEALAVQQRLGYARGVGLAYSNLGSALMFQQKYGEALAALGEALVVLRPIGDKEKLSIALENLGVTLLRMGEHEQAVARHREAMQLSREMDDLQGMASSLACIAAAVAQRGEPLRAARLWGAAQVMWIESSAPMLPAQKQRFMPEIEQAQARLDAATFEAAMRDGAVMDLLQILDEAGIA